MLLGVTRKISIPVLLLSLTGWLVYGVGFGLRNFKYKDVGNGAAAAPDYIFLWLFLCSAPVIFALGFLHSLWESKIPSFLIYLVLPCFLISAGAILFLNGSSVYAYHQENRVNIRCLDAKAPPNSDIHKERSYIPVELAGVVVSVIFYWVYLLMQPFFASKYTAQESY